MTLGIPVTPTHQAPPINIQQLPPLGPHRKTLERNIRNNHHNQLPPIPGMVESTKMMMDGNVWLISLPSQWCLNMKSSFHSCRWLRLGNSSCSYGIHPSTAFARLQQLNQQQPAHCEKSRSPPAVTDAESSVKTKARHRTVNGEPQQREQYWSVRSKSACGRQQSSLKKTSPKSLRNKTTWMSARRNKHFLDGKRDENSWKMKKKIVILKMIFEMMCVTLNYN